MAASEVNLPNIDTWQPPCEGIRELSMDSPTSVIVMTVEDDGSLWVIPESERQIFDEIAIALQGLMPPDDVEPVTVNQTCAAFFSDGNWYRARLMTTEPEITVHFIDLGNTSMVAADEITTLPSSVTIYPPLATKIELPIDCQLQPAESDLLTVIPISKRENVTVVDVIGPKIEEGFSKTLADVCASESSSESQPNISHAFILEHSPKGGMSFPPEELLSSRASTPDHLSSASEIVSSEGSNDCSQIKVTSDVSENVKPVSDPEGYPSDGSVTAKTPDLLIVGTEGVLEGSIPKGCKSIVHSEEAALDESQKNPLCVVESTSEVCTVSAPLEVNNSAPDTTTGRSISSSNLLESMSLDSNELEVHPCSSSSFVPDNIKMKEKINSPAEEIQPQITDNLKCLQIREVKSNEISHWKDQDNLISDECSSSGSRSGMSQDCDPFISALGRYPHLGGGYGPSHPDSYNAETYQDLQEPPKHTQGNLLTQSLGRGKLGSCNDDADWQSFSTSSSRCSDIKTPSSKQKGRYQPNVDRSIRLRSQHHPPNAQSGSGTASGTCADDGASMDLKAKLDFELAILREQNRLQMLQMQKQMDEHVSRLTQQLDGLRDEVMKRIAVMGNEMSNRLLVVNDSVVQKMAQFYSDIASLKNAQVLNRQHDGRELTSNHLMKQAQAQEAQDYGDQVYFQQRQQNQYGNSGRQLSSQNSHVDRRPQNSYTRQQTGEQQYQHSEKERSYSGGGETPVTRLSSMRNEKMTEQEPTQRQHLNSHHQQQHSHQQHTNHKSQQRQLPHQQQQQHQQHKWQDQQHHNHQSKHFNGRGTYNQPSHTQHSQNNFYPKDHFNPNDLEKVQESKWGDDGDNSSKISSGGVICVANFDCKKITPDILYNLFGVYGNVMRVKINSDKEQGFVEMADAAQAEAGIQYLNGVMLMGQPLQVTPCNFQHVMLNRLDISSKMGKDYSKPTQNRYHRFKPGTWNSSKVFPPCERLMITNILRTVSEDKIKETFAKNGFNLLSVNCYPTVNEEKKYAFVSLSTVEEAVAALVEMHLTELSDWMQMKISFAKAPKNE